VKDKGCSYESIVTKGRTNSIMKGVSIQGSGGQTGEIPVVKEKDQGKENHGVSSMSVSGVIGQGEVVQLSQGLMGNVLSG